MTQVSQTRTIRGYAVIAKGDEPRRIGEGVYEVRSQSGSGSYRLTKHNAGWSCTCPDYVSRHELVGDCKHVNALRLWLKAKEATEQTDTFELPKTVLSFEHCRFCNSVDLLRWGYRKTRQSNRPRFKCRTCGKRFVVDEGFHIEPVITGSHPSVSGWSSSALTTLLEESLFEVSSLRLRSRERACSPFSATS